MKMRTDKFCPHCTGEKGSVAVKYDDLLQKFKTNGSTKGDRVLTVQFSTEEHIYP